MVYRNTQKKVLSRVTEVIVSLLYDGVNTLVDKWLNLLVSY